MNKKFLGRHLMLKKEYAEALLEGRKTSTIRLGVVVPRYNELVVHSGGKPIAVVKLTEVYHKKIKELTLDEVREDGFRSRKELVRALRRLYPREKIDEESVVTLIKFKLKKRLEGLTEDEYKRLEPALVARLALRYLGDKLGDEEKRILFDLTRTNSIRRTAYNIYGNALNRSRIRKVLRTSLEMLRTMGKI